jgi:hypothetical protein
MSIADELTKLEDLRRNGTLSEAEFAKAKELLLNSPPPPSQEPLVQHLAQQQAEIKHQNELARIDREWEMQKQQYYVTTRYGVRQLPTTGMGIGIAVIGGVFGVFWTIMAIAITSGAPDVGPFAIVKIIFPLFGVLFTGAAIVFGIVCNIRAKKYQEAYEAYQRRRQQVRQEEHR